MIGLKLTAITGVAPAKVVPRLFLGLLLEPTILPEDKFQRSSSDRRSRDYLRG